MRKLPPLQKSRTLLGVPLSYAPWPYDFDNVLPGPTILRYVGIPVPMVAIRQLGQLHVIDPVFHVFAFILNGIFASGVAHAAMLAYSIRAMRSVDNASCSNDDSCPSTHED